MPKRRQVVCFVLCICLGLTTGCWDVTEPNQRAIWVGSGIDKAGDSNVRISAQLAFPAGLGEGGGGGEAKGTKYLVESATGSNVFDATENLQEKLSRRVFIGHRDAVFIGEGMAQRGLKSWLDEFGRNPDSNVRAKVFLVRGADSKTFLEQTAGLERFPTTAAIRASRFSGVNDVVTSVRYFDNNMLSDGIRPFLQAITINTDSQSTNQSNQQPPANASPISMNSIALFNRNAQLVGYLQNQEASLAMWVAGDLIKYSVTEYMPKGHGTISLDLTHVRRRLNSVVDGNKIAVNVHLTGTGFIRENNSSLDLYSRQSIRQVECVFNQKIQQDVLRMISEVQQKYRTDMFGFGEDIHRRHPNAWNVSKRDWDEEFPHVKVTVHVDLRVRHIGNKGPGYTVPSRGSQN